MKATKIVEINELLNELSNVKISETDRQIYFIVSEITKKRKSLGFTQQILSEKAGLSKNTISRIENFDVSPSLEALIQITNALNMKLLLTSK